jgi:hypothetical protein
MHLLKQPTAPYIAPKIPGEIRFKKRNSLRLKSTTLNRAYKASFQWFFFGSTKIYFYRQRLLEAILGRGDKRFIPIAHVCFSVLYQLRKIFDNLIAGASDLSQRNARVTEGLALTSFGTIFGYASNRCKVHARAFQRLLWVGSRLS